jgi:hypothetical protein
VVGTGGTGAAAVGTASVARGERALLAAVAAVGTVCSGVSPEGDLPLCTGASPAVGFIVGATVAPLAEVDAPLAAGCAGESLLLPAAAAAGTCPAVAVGAAAVGLAVGADLLLVAAREVAVTVGSLCISLSCLCISSVKHIAVVVAAVVVC